MNTGPWFVYMLRCRDNTLYCGISTDIQRRLAQHNGQLSGGPKYTASRRPVNLLGKFICGDKSSALKLEYQIKKLSRKDKLSLFSKADANAWL